MSARDQVGRMLALVPYLQARPNAPLAEVAEHFGVSPEQLRSDLSVLFMCGLPGMMPDDLIEIDMDAVDGRGVINLSNADYLSRPLRFTPAEITPLILGLDLIRELAGPEVTTVVDSAAKKLREAAGEAASEAGRLTVTVLGADAPVRGQLSEAIEAGERLRLTYDSESRAERTVREVDPVEISTRGGFAYLEAFSLQPEGWRTFRLDRIVDVQRTGEPAVDHPDRPAPAADWAQALAAADRVRLRLAPSARWLAEYHVVEDLSEGPDGSLDATFAIGDPHWLTRLLLQWGAQVQVLEPADTELPAAEAAEAALAAYRATDPLGATEATG